MTQTTPGIQKVFGFCPMTLFRSFENSDFEFDEIVKSPRSVMPDLIRHPDVLEIT
jgi:hypothetical protein